MITFKDETEFLGLDRDQIEAAITAKRPHTSLLARTLLCDQCGSLCRQTSPRYYGCPSGHGRLRPRGLVEEMIRAAIADWLAPLEKFYKRQSKSRWVKGLGDEEFALVFMDGKHILPPLFYDPEPGQELGIAYGHVRVFEKAKER